MKYVVLVLLVGSALAAAPTTAQTTLYIVGGPAFPTGEAMDGIEAGLKFTAGAAYGLSERLSVYAEGQLGSHDVESSGTSVSPSALMAGLGLGVGSPEGALRPYIFGGVGIQTIGVDDDSLDPKDSTLGYQVGGGVMFRLFGLPSALQANYQAASFDADSELGDFDFAIFSLGLAFALRVGGS